MKKPINKRKRLTSEEEGWMLELAKLAHDQSQRFQPVIDVLNRQIHELGKLEPQYRQIFGMLQGIEAKLSSLEAIQKHKGKTKPRGKKK